MYTDFSHYHLATLLWWTNSRWIELRTALRQIASHCTTCAHVHTCAACHASVASVWCAAQVCSQLYTLSQRYTSSSPFSVAKLFSWKSVFLKYENPYKSVHRTQEFVQIRTNCLFIIVLMPAIHYTWFARIRNSCTIPANKLRIANLHELLSIHYSWIRQICE